MSAQQPPFGVVLRRWRERRRMTQMDLAFAANASTRHLSYLETGRAHPSREMVMRLGEYLDRFNTAANSFIARAQAFFLHQTADPVAAQQLGLQKLENLRQQQASSLAYFDCCWLFAVLTFVLVFLALFFMKRSVAKKGSHHAVE